MGNFCLVISKNDDYQHCQPEKLSDVDDYINEMGGTKSQLDLATSIKDSYHDWCENTGCTIGWDKIQPMIANHNLKLIISLASVDDVKLFIIE